MAENTQGEWFVVETLAYGNQFLIAAIFNKGDLFFVEYKPETSTISIRRLVESAATGDLDIPEFQRDFVWTKDQVSELLDSLIKGYPIGSLLVWDFSNYASGKHIVESSRRKLWIVDGQQRIVSLCLLMSKKPYWMAPTEWNRLLAKYKIKVDILTLEVIPEHPVVKKDPKWVYPQDIFSKREEDLEKLATEISNKIDNKLFGKVFTNIKRIWDLQHVDIPIIRVNTTLEDIVTIFERINRKGTRVKQADVVLAYIASYNEGWIREEFAKYLDTLEDKGYEFDPALMIRAIAAIGEGRVVLRDVTDDFLENKNGKLDEAFSHFKRSMERIICDLTNVGILSSKLIYAKNTILPLLYLCHRFQNQFDFNKAFHFFLLALAQGRYSGSAESALQDDINIIKSAGSFQEAIENLHKRFDKTDIKKLIAKETVRDSVHYQAEGRFLKLLLYLIVYGNKAVDWFTKVRLGFYERDEVNRDFTIEEHHFFPKSLLRSVGYDEEQREALANIVFVNPGTNRRLRDEPYVYIKKYGIVKDELLKQLIPENEELWRLDNYEKFLDERSGIIANQLANFLRNLYPQFYQE